MPQKPAFDLNDTSNRVIAAIFIALLFIGGWWLIARNQSSNDALSEETEEQSAKPSVYTSTASADSVLGPLADDAPIITGSNESLDVADQGAGTNVVVRGATLVQMGWIAVRDSSGRTLGAGRFEPGVYTYVEVPLLRGTSAGEHYQALIYVDDGDKEFDLHKDILVTEADGSVAGDLFAAK